MGGELKARSAVIKCLERSPLLDLGGATGVRSYGLPVSDRVIQVVQVAGHNVATVHLEDTVTGDLRHVGPSLRLAEAIKLACWWQSPWHALPNGVEFRCVVHLGTYGRLLTDIFRRLPRAVWWVNLGLSWNVQYLCERVCLYGGMLQAVADRIVDDRRLRGDRRHEAAGFVEHGARHGGHGIGPAGSSSNFARNCS